MSTSKPEVLIWWLIRGMEVWEIKNAAQYLLN